ncbi:MAG: MerR family transcriptional regulator [Desulfuromonadaceae bacterium]|nr:MerR family transcriptional regulator [Desulfuromonadaceae bacterium]MDD5107088.1 MerR family transcriptional regulator [Desulfuromonadaceae bacterium]
MASPIPEKLYYKIGEVAEFAGVKTSVLRFWESEFPFLNPVKSVSGQRLYSREDVELVLQVRQLLYEEKYTIEGVKKRISARKNKFQSEAKLQDVFVLDYCEILRAVRNDLKIVRDLL